MLMPNYPKQCPASGAHETLGIVSMAQSYMLGVWDNFPNGRLELPLTVLPLHCPRLQQWSVDCLPFKPLAHPCCSMHVGAYVNWASQEGCLFHLRVSLQPSGFLSFHFCMLFPFLSFSHHHLGLLFPILTSNIPTSRDRRPNSLGIGASSSRWLLC